MKVADVVEETEGAWGGREVVDSPITVQARSRHKDGVSFPVEMRLGSVHVGGKSATFALVRDITERNRAEQALRASERKYRELVESANSIILRWDDEGCISFINPFGAELFGYGGEELIGASILEILVPETGRATKRDLAQLMEKIKKRPERFRNNELEHLKKNGESVWVSWTNRAVLDEQGRVEEILSVGSDITDKKRLESRLLHAQKMEAIGTLAGGVAHDFNNLLMAVQGHVDMMLLGVDPHHAHHERLKTIEALVTSGANLTRQLLGFARGGRYEWKNTNMNKVIEKTSAMFGRAKKEITIHADFEKEL